MHTTTTQPLSLTSEANVFYFRSLFHWSLEEMADMDELFGSDGDSDNDQRGDHALIFIMLRAE